MLPPDEALPDVLPTDRLLRTGMAVPALRDELRRIANVRNALSVVGLWAATIALIGVTVWSGNPFVYAVTFVLMGPMFARFAILGHEAAHRLLFSSKRWNDL